MSLIPPDAAIRLRMQTEASLSPVAALKPLPADLQDLRPGQSFTAQIRQQLPENTYRALVGGKEITLSLPSTVNTGDTLELVVVEHNPRMVLARLANTLPNQTDTTNEQGGNASGTTQLSPAGQMIGKLLLPAGQQPQPVPLNRGIPLLPTPLPAANEIAAALAPRLEQAATQSGLFYEAHQALWLTGQRSTEALLKEPQAQHAPPPGNRSLASTEPATAQGQHKIAEIASGSNAANLPQPVTATESNSTSGIKDLLQSIPAELRPLVQQQLDTVATQRLIWQGEVWPGQTLQWEISRETPEHPSATPDQAGQWNTSLALTTPQLGRVEAVLGIAGHTVRIALAADSPESVSKLNSRLPALRSALEAAGLKPIGLKVQDGNAV